MATQEVANTSTRSRHSNGGQNGVFVVMFKPTCCVCSDAELLKHHFGDVDGFVVEPLIIDRMFNWDALLMSDSMARYTLLSKTPSLIPPPPSQKTYVVYTPFIALTKSWDICKKLVHGVNAKYNHINGPIPLGLSLFVVPIPVTSPPQSPQRQQPSKMETPRYQMIQSIKEILQLHLKQCNRYFGHDGGEAVFIHGTTTIGVTKALKQHAGANIHGDDDLIIKMSGKHPFLSLPPRSPTLDQMQVSTIYHNAISRIFSIVLDFPPLLATEVRVGYSGFTTTKTSTPLVGRLDLLFWDPDEQCIVIGEIKTTLTPHNLQEEFYLCTSDAIRQLHGYAMMLEHDLATLHGPDVIPLKVGYFLIVGYAIASDTIYRWKVPRDDSLFLDWINQ